MDLIEHKYIPHNLHDIITPNKEAIIEQINNHITTKNMNLLLIYVEQDTIVIILTKLMKIPILFMKVIL